MEVIIQVEAADARHPLRHLLEFSLGLDVWEVKGDRAVVRTSVAQAERLQQIGYRIEQLHLTEAYLATFAPKAGPALYHSAQSLEADLRRLAERRPDVVELHEIGRSVEDRPIWALRIGARRPGVPKVLFLGCHHAREWIAVEVPYLLAAHHIAATSGGTESPCSGTRRNRSANSSASFLVDPGFEMSLLPLLRPALERGDVTVRVRVLADASDQRFVRTLLQRAMTAFLGAATGIMAVLLLNATGGPDVTSALHCSTCWATTSCSSAPCSCGRALTMDSHHPKD